MTKSEDSSSRNNVFDSVDFNNFLLQKTNGILNDSSIFKSKEFVKSVLSKDWESKPFSGKSLRVGGNEKPRKAAENSITTTTIDSATNSPISKEGRSLIQKSQDWIKFNTLGKHVEIPLSIGMFSSNVGSKQQSKAPLSIPSSPSIRTDSKPSLTMHLHETPVAAISIPKVASIVEPTKKKKRKRAPRKKVIPQNKKYLVPTETDVLMGRGGKSNHHTGNMKYRAEIERLQGQYKKAVDKDEKTNISEKLVLHVQSYGGNFLEKDDGGWYIIDDVVARRKVSQALREDKDPDKRRAKRQRFLLKRTRFQEDALKKDFHMGK